MVSSNFFRQSRVSLLIIILYLAVLITSLALNRGETNAAVLSPTGILRVSVASDGTQANGDSFSPAISADGRFVAFHSDANSLVPVDTNGSPDVFVHDQQTGLTELISLSSIGIQGNSTSKDPSISGDGRIVAFWSYATNLVAGDTNNLDDVFVRDRQTGQTTRVSQTSLKGQSCGDHPSISADGRYIAFQSLCTNLSPHDTNNTSDVFVHDRQTGATEIVSVASDGTQGNGESSSPIISADGRFVAFESISTNLVSGDTNAVKDLFVHDRQTGRTERVSVASDGAQSNKTCGPAACSLALSSDGRFVAFHSSATNLVAGDTNNWPDIFVHDRLTGETTRVSVASDGAQGNDVSYNPSISSDGRYVSFDSLASNLVPGDTAYYYDVFVHDRQTGNTSRVSVNTAGAEGNGYSRHPKISANMLWIAYSSSAANLVSGDTNQSQDIFEAAGAVRQIRIFLPIMIK